jgi:hypothetical protein
MVGGVKPKSQRGMIEQDQRSDAMPNLEPAVVAELEAIYERAMKLPPDAISMLADRLAPNFPADPELQAELQRRWDEFEKGNAKTYTHQEVMSVLRKATGIAS